MVIYTKLGDKGETSILNEDSTQRKRVSKDSLRVEVLGAIDELNSFLGICKSSLNDNLTIRTIRLIQKDLFSIGSITAGSKLRFSSTKIKKLESKIDFLEGKLPVLKNFIIPGGTLSAAQLHYARSLARRLERGMVALSKLEKVKPQILKYLNRLSDFLFMLAREENAKKGVNEEVWIGKSRK